MPATTPEQNSSRHIKAEWSERINRRYSRLEPDSETFSKLFRNALRLPARIAAVSHMLPPTIPEPVALGQRAIALLQILVEGGGSPISKDRLIESAWPGLVIEESNLPVQIAALRRVFAEEPGGNSWIETLGSRGAEPWQLSDRILRDDRHGASSGDQPFAPSVCPTSWDAGKRDLLLQPCVIKRWSVWTGQLNSVRVPSLVAQLVRHSCDGHH
jgi:hypothetical protein